MLNCNPGEVPADVAFCSVGLHPWDVAADWPDKVAQLRRDVQLPNVRAIGECGLDALRGCDMSVQTAAFLAQIEVSEAVQKPVLIHCVRSFDRLLRLHKQCRPRQLWIVHGFRGKPALAQQIMAKGMLLSFGHVFNAETLSMVATSSHPFFLETDCDEVGLRSVCHRVTDALAHRPGFPDGQTPSRLAFRPYSFCHRDVNAPSGSPLLQWALCGLPISLNGGQ